MIITLAKYGGYCFGVKRAINMALEGVKTCRILYSAGPLIHNKAVISSLHEKGVVTLEDMSGIPEGASVIIRAHGITAEEYAELEAKGCIVIDATCPFVARIHGIARDEAQKGRTVGIAGGANHPEVRGIMSRCGGYAVENMDELESLPFDLAQTPVSLVSQTTFNKEIWFKFVNYLKNTCKDLQVFDTICNATDYRQSEAIKSAQGSDAVVVVGDKGSNNTRNLFELCRQRCERTFFVESADQINLDDFKRDDRVFVTAGASAPDFIIKEVVNKMDEEKILQLEEESFEQLVEQSLKTLHTGEKVTGTVLQINNTDIHVDLGVKQAGIIPMSEVSSDPNFNVAENIHVGDEIEAYVLRVNDVEGIVQLSKKRLDAVKDWLNIENAVETKEPLMGTIVEQNKGGVVANVNGIRVFIPARQTGIPKDGSFDSLINTTHPIRIIEANKHRHSVVGSIKAPIAEQRRAAAAQIWDNIEEGKTYTGIVKSFTNYGAFVDIGGVDGMIHISELSWNRIKHPSEVLTIGQEVEVFVIGFDAEKRKISLGYRKAEDNPWNKFVDLYHEDDIVNVTIIKFMPFGAFASIIPGVDGLIHISQIANRRIGKPDDVLTIGQQIDAKITHIDYENKKISLSIRALLQPEETAEEVPAEEAAVEEAPAEEAHTEETPSEE